MRDAVSVSQGNAERETHNDPAYRTFVGPFRRFRGIPRTVLPALLICLLAPAAVALAQEPPKAAASNPGGSLNAFNKRAYGQLKDALMRSAEKMPEEEYNFKPTWVVRNFGQMIGHVAESQYFFCSLVLGEKNSTSKIERAKTSKADLIAALKDAFAYCDRAHASITDESATQRLKLFGEEMRRVDVLTVNNLHIVEHYGNLVIYLRLKNIVPPTSEP